MPPIKRYEEDFPEGMAEDIDGKWVLYEDHAAEVNRIVAKKAFWCNDVARFGSGDCTTQCDHCAAMKQSRVAALLKEARDWIDTVEYHPDLIERIDKVLSE